MLKDARTSRKRCSTRTSSARSWTTRAKLTAIVVESPQGRHAIAGTAFVDCTGLGDVAAWAGADEPRRAVHGRAGVHRGVVDSAYAWVDKHKEPLDPSDKEWLKHRSARSRT